MSLPSLTIVIPAYNEGDRLRRHVELIRQAAVKRDELWELIVVDDGSADGTAKSLADFEAAPMTFRLLRNDGNRGKGYSVRRGMLEAIGEAVLMTDADLSTPIDEVDKLLRELGGKVAVVIGSRDMPDSVLQPPQPWTRRLMGRVFRLIRRSLGLVPALRDTQCGFKLFGAEAAREVFSRVTQEGFAFDCEALALADRLGYGVKEVGVRWHDEPDSRVRPVRDSLRMFVALWRIRRRMAKGFAKGSADS